MLRGKTKKFKVVMITGISALVLGVSAVTVFAATDWFQPSVRYSVDGGETWNDASENDDIEVYIGEYNDEEAIQVSFRMECEDDECENLDGEEMIIEVNLEEDTD